MYISSMEFLMELLKNMVVMECNSMKMIFLYSILSIENAPDKRFSFAFYTGR